MKKSVGLILVMRLSENSVPMLILQRRGRWNTEKCAPESYPGCCQVTVHGGLKEDESFLEALSRESREELGRAFTVTYEKDVHLIRLVEVRNDKKEVITYGGIVMPERLRLVQLGPDSGGFDPITMEEALQIVPITDEMKIIGPPPGVRAMFPDEIEAVGKAFEFLL